MKKNVVAALISISLTALIGLAAYETVHLVGGWISDILGVCVAESDADCHSNETDR